MMTVMMRACVATVFLSAVAAGSAQSQVPDVRGFHLGAAGNATSIAMDETTFSDDERENGYGAGLYVGYNFSRMLGITFGIAAASIARRCRS